MSITGSKLFRRMHVVGNGEQEWYVFDFKEAATVPWMVALHNTVDALYVCHMDHTGGLQITDFEVTQELLYMYHRLEGKYEYGLETRHVSNPWYVFLITFLQLLRNELCLLPRKATEDNRAGLGREEQGLDTYQALGIFKK